MRILPFKSKINKYYVIKILQLKKIITEFLVEIKKW